EVFTQRDVSASYRPAPPHVRVECSANSIGGSTGKAMRIEQLLRDGAETHGAKPALVAGRVAYTFTDVDRKSDRLAAALVQRGLTPGSRVALFLDHSVPAIVSVFAILKAGCV